MTQCQLVMIVQAAAMLHYDGATFASYQNLNDMMQSYELLLLTNEHCRTFWLLQARGLYGEQESNQCTCTCSLQEAARILEDAGEELQIRHVCRALEKVAPLLQLAQ